MFYMTLCGPAKSWCVPPLLCHVGVTYRGGSCALCRLPGFFIMHSLMNILVPHRHFCGGNFEAHAWDHK